MLSGTPTRQAKAYYNAFRLPVFYNPQSAHRPPNTKNQNQRSPMMTIHLPESRYTLIPLITPEDTPAQAILKAPPRPRGRLWK